MLNKALSFILYSEQNHDSLEFIATESQRKSLNLVVMETLAGNSNATKGFAVATRLFRRGDDFYEISELSSETDSMEKGFQSLLNF